MIQLNLLPDVKLEYIKAERSRRLVLSVSFLVTAAAIVLLLLLLSVDGLQRKHLHDLTGDINTESSKLQSEPQISKILTVQNQLQSLTALHAQEPAAGQVFGYLNQITPSNVSINDFKIDFTQQTMIITGTAANLADVNRYVDTLKYTTFTTGSNTQSQPAFKNIVLSSFSLNSGQNSGQAASYTINLSYNPAIFDITQNAKLTVPNVTTTHLTVGQPTTDLFKAAPAPPPKGGQ